MNLWVAFTHENLDLTLEKFKWNLKIETENKLRTLLSLIKNWVTNANYNITEAKTTILHTLQGSNELQFI